MKECKSAGGDGIINEVWKFGGREVKDWLWELCNRVWRQKSWSKE